MPIVATEPHHVLFEHENEYRWQSLWEDNDRPDSRDSLRLNLRWRGHCISCFVDQWCDGWSHWWKCNVQVDGSRYKDFLSETPTMATWTAWDLVFDHLRKHNS